MKKNILIILTIILAFLCVSCKKSIREIPSDYPDIEWVSTDGVLDLKVGYNGFFGTFTTEEKKYDISVGWNNTSEKFYFRENNQEMPLMLSGNIKKTADMEFTLTVNEDNYFNFKYKEFVLVDKATITN